MSTIDNSDPRYVRSRLKLRAAFLELAHDDPEKLTVSAVCERTGIDRATFYRHFDTMDGLVADALGDLVDEATSRWEATSTGSGTQLAESTAIFAGYLHHIEENWRLYRWALGSTGSTMTMHALMERMSRGVASELQKLVPGITDEERRFRAAYSAGGILGACIHWLSSETPGWSSEEVTRRILRIAEQPLETLP